MLQRSFRRRAILIFAAAALIILAPAVFLAYAVLDLYAGFTKPSCERAIERKMKEMNMTTPIGLAYQPEEYRKNWKRIRAEHALVMPVFRKHREKFWRQPNVWGMGPGRIQDENGEETGELGITIYVTKKVPQDQLPPEDRIPDRIGCVRIQIIEKPNNAILWRYSTLSHRPVRATVVVTSPSPSGGDPGLGTLTGLATRNSDGQRVLVTNVHVATGGYGRLPTGNEELYHPETTNPDYKVARILEWVRVNPGQDNIADVAIFKLLTEPSSDDEVESTFDTHSHCDDLDAHDFGSVVAGTVEPEEGKDLVVFWGGGSGKGVTRVKEVNQERTVGGVRFTGVTILDLSQNSGGTGDSGAPCLHENGSGRYQMTRIMFRGSEDGSEGYAFPASVAERRLDITFGVPKKEHLLDGIDLASKYLLRSTGPSLKPNASTGVIEEDWSTVVPSQTMGDAPIVCVVPTTGAITKGTPVTDEKGVTYTPVRLPGGLSAYKYLQPNNDHYATIMDSSITHDRTSSPKTTTGWARVKFIDKDRAEGSQDMMEMEVRKITRWGSAQLHAGVRVPGEGQLLWFGLQHCSRGVPA